MQHRTRIKICGITRTQDAVAAAEAGADAIGMILYEKAPRYITIDRAKEIRAVLPPFITIVGVFVDATFDHIVSTASSVGLDMVQLNGNETPEFVSDLEGLRVLKAVRVKSDTLAASIALWRDCRHVNGIVLEPGHTNEAGGTGTPNDWNAVQRELGQDGTHLPIIAAGGLTPENVGDVVRRIRPYAVDVSSGVESEPGIKSKEKIEAFVQAVRETDSG